MTGHDVHKVNVVTQRSEPGRIHSGSASDIDDSGSRRRKKPVQQLLRANKAPALGPPIPVKLEKSGIAHVHAGTFRICKGYHP